MTAAELEQQHVSGQRQPSRWAHPRSWIVAAVCALLVSIVCTVGVRIYRVRAAVAAIQRH